MSYDNTPPSPLTVSSASFDNGAPAPATPDSINFDNTAPGKISPDEAEFAILADAEEFEADGLIGGTLKAVNLDDGSTAGPYTIDDNAAIDSSYELDISTSAAMGDIDVDPADWRIFITTPDGRLYEGTIADLPVSDAITVTITKSHPAGATPESASFDNNAPGALTPDSISFDNGAPSPLTPTI